MKRFLIIFLMLSLVIGFSLANSAKTNAQQIDVEKETSYLSIAQDLIKQTLGSIDEYGSFHIERVNGTKFVFAFSKEDAKTDSLKSLLIKQFPADLLEIRTGYKFPYGELFRVNAELGANWEQLNSDGTQIVETSTDENNDKVVIKATSMTDATKDYLIKKYGREILNIEISSNNQGTLGAFGFQ
jgi:hypothetical protein